MVTGRDVLVQREYYREQVRMTERAALARRSGKQGDLAQRLPSLLNRLGTQLVAWGTRLEEQYEAVVSGEAVISPPPAQPAVGQ